MDENRAVSEGTNETQNQSKQLAVRFAPEVVARIEQTPQHTTLVQPRSCARLYANTTAERASKRS